MLNSWINKFLAPFSARNERAAGRRNRDARRTHRSLPRFEALETRILLSNVTVTNSADVTDGDIRSIDALIHDPGRDGTISLREAIMASNRTAGVDVITFDRAISGRPIQLAEAPLVINSSLKIEGLGAGRTTLQAADNAPIFVIETTYTDPGAVLLDGMLLTGCNSYGAILAQFAYLTVSNCTIEGNDAGRYASAGGINSMSHLTVMNSTISGNSASSGSGGIRAQGDLTIINSTISDNSGYNGGVFGTDVNIIDSTISGNTAIRSGGGVEASGKLTISGSTISGNSADYSGAGIDVRRGASAIIINSTICDNIGGFGGGIFADDLTILSISHSTIFGNSAGDGGFGGGIYTFGTVNVDSSIIAGNTFLGEGGSPDLYSDSGMANITNSLIGDYTGSGLEPTLHGVRDANGNFVGAPDALLDPRLDRLADNGGPTQTRALLVGSLAIDTGNVNAENLPLYDQRGRGFARISGGRVDIGAYEVQRSLFTATVRVSDPTGTFNSGPFPAVATVAGEDGVFTASLEGEAPTLTYYAGPTAEGEALSDAPIHAGTYTVVANFAGSAHYSRASAAVTFTIAQATPIFRILKSSTIVLGTDSISISGQISLGTLLPSGTVTIRVGTITVSATVQRDGTFSASLLTGTLRAGSYVIDYRYGGDTDFRATSDTQVLVVLSAPQETRLIVDEVAALVTAGVLNGGNGKALTVSLSNSATSLDKGTTTPGINQLNAVQKKVDAFSKTGKLTDSAGRALSAEIDSVMAAAVDGTISPLRTSKI